MRPVINQMIQLQELTLAKKEREVVARGKPVQQLDESIKAMTEKLPAEIRAMFEKLIARHHVVITSVSDGGCSACGIRLPVSLVQSVKAARNLQNCPNCARMLYYPDVVPRQTRGARPRSEPARLGISKFSSPRLMIPRLESTDKEGAIRELARKMESEGFVNRADRLAEMALQREAILSTAIDSGLAFPHVRGVEGGGVTLALGISPKGIEFNAPDGDLTRIIFFVAIPTAASAFYLRLLAGLTETFMDTEVRNSIIAEDQPQDLWWVLARITWKTMG